MSFLEKINPINWIKNTVGKRIVGSVVRKLIVGAGTLLTYLGTITGEPEAGATLAKEIAENSDDIYKLAVGVIMVLVGLAWGALDKFKNK